MLRTNQYHLFVLQLVCHQFAAVFCSGIGHKVHFINPVSNIVYIMKMCGGEDPSEVVRFVNSIFSVYILLSYFFSLLVQSLKLNMSDVPRFVYGGLIHIMYDFNVVTMLESP